MIFKKLSKLIPKQSRLIILITVVPCIVLGLLAYRWINANNPKQSRQEPEMKKDEPNVIGWPVVQTLSLSGVSQISKEQLLLCKKEINSGNEKFRPADKSNYGERNVKDQIGRDIPHNPELIVLHETVMSADETIKLFQTPHPNDNGQGSYHALVDRSGSLIRIVPDENRAYGAGYSRFGDFTVYSKSKDNFSINNVALHISLETPADGRSDTASHSGYTIQQYNALAKQVLLWQAEYRIPVFRITTHANVDRSHSRYDPRVFRWDVFDYYHRQHAKTCGLDHLTLQT